MFRFLEKTFTGLSVIIVKTSDHTKCISLSNQQCMIQPTLLNLHPNELTERLGYYPIAVT